MIINHLNYHSDLRSTKTTIVPIASTILMVRPAAFGFNAETAANNYFQSNPDINKEEIQQNALIEFDNMVQTLRSHDIDVLVIEDSKEPAKPDAIFPNNWVSFHSNGVIMNHIVVRVLTRLNSVLCGECEEWTNPNFVKNLYLSLTVTKHHRYN